MIIIIVQQHEHSNIGEKKNNLKLLCMNRLINKIVPTSMLLRSKLCGFRSLKI